MSWGGGVKLKARKLSRPNGAAQSLPLRENIMCLDPSSVGCFRKNKQILCIRLRLSAWYGYPTGNFVEPVGILVQHLLLWIGPRLSSLLENRRQCCGSVSFWYGSGSWSRMWKICYGSGSGSRVNFDSDPDPGKNDTDPDVFNGFSWIRIRIIWYGSGFRIQPFFYMDPDPEKWYRFHGSGSGSATLIVGDF